MIQNCKPFSTLLFLYNFEKKSFVGGIFCATAVPRTNLWKTSWQNRFPAQVLVRKVSSYTNVTFGRIGKVNVLNPKIIRSGIPPGIYSEIVADLAAASAKFLLYTVAPAFRNDTWTLRHGKVTVLLDVSEIAGCKRSLAFHFPEEGQVKDVRNFLPFVFGEKASPRRFILKARKSGNILHDFQTFPYLKWNANAVSPEITVFDADKHGPINALDMEREYVKFSSWFQALAERKKSKSEKRESKEESKKSAAGGGNSDLEQYCLKVKEYLLKREWKNDGEALLCTVGSVLPVPKSLRTGKKPLRKVLEGSSLGFIVDISTGKVWLGKQGESPEGSKPSPPEDSRPSLLKDPPPPPPERSKPPPPSTPLPPDETITIRVKDVGGNETKFKILKARTKMIKVFNAYAKRNGVLTSKLRFLIGGERVNPESTAATLGLENQDEIDVLGELSDDDGEEGGIIFKPTKTVSLDRSPKFQCKGCMKRFIDWPTCNRHIKNSDHLPLRKTNAPTDASYLRDICTIGRLERSTDTKQKLLPDKMVEVRLSWARPYFSPKPGREVLPFSIDRDADMASIVEFLTTDSLFTAEAQQEWCPDEFLNSTGQSWRICLPHIASSSAKPRELLFEETLCHAYLYSMFLHEDVFESPGSGGEVHLVLHPVSLATGEPSRQTKPLPPCPPGFNSTSTATASNGYPGPPPTAEDMDIQRQQNKRMPPPGFSPKIDVIGEPSKGLLNKHESVSKGFESLSLDNDSKGFLSLLTPSGDSVLKRADSSEFPRLPSSIKTTGIEKRPGAQEKLSAHEGKSYAALDWKTQGEPPKPRKTEAFGKRILDMKREATAGYMFFSNHETFTTCLPEENVSLENYEGIFGDVKGCIQNMRENIDEHTPLFLFNLSSKQLHGIFFCKGKPGILLDKSKFCDIGSTYCKFPSQVRVEYSSQHRKTHQLRERASFNYKRGPLTLNETNALIAMLGFKGLSLNAHYRKAVSTQPTISPFDELLDAAMRARVPVPQENPVLIIDGIDLVQNKNAPGYNKMIPRKSSPGKAACVAIAQLLEKGYDNVVVAMPKPLFLKCMKHEQFEELDQGKHVYIQPSDAEEGNVFMLEHALSAKFHGRAVVLSTSFSSNVESLIGDPNRQRFFHSWKSSRIFDFTWVRGNLYLGKNVPPANHKTAMIKEYVCPLDELLRRDCIQSCVACILHTVNKWDLKPLDDDRSLSKRANKTISNWIFDCSRDGGLFRDNMLPINDNFVEEHFRKRFYNEFDPQVNKGKIATALYNSVMKNVESAIAEIKKQKGSPPISHSRRKVDWLGKPTVTLQCLNGQEFVELPIYRSHYTALAQAHQSSGDRNVGYDSQYLDSRIFSMLQRYETLWSKNSGAQGALPDAVFDILKRELLVAGECFASPLNHRLDKYYSAFPDTDKCFGSLGSFYKSYGMEGSWECNPPFDTKSVVKALEQIKQLLTEATEQFNILSFAVFFGEFSADSRVGMIIDDLKPFLRASTVAHEHVYLYGFQHRSAGGHGNVHWKALRPTQILLLQSDEAFKNICYSSQKKASNILEEVKVAFNQPLDRTAQ
jgi:hypothetical protein